MNLKHMEQGKFPASHGNNYPLQKPTGQLTKVIKAISVKNLMANVDVITNHRTPHKAPTVILRCPKVLERTAISRAALYEKMRPTSKYFDPTFPRSIRISERSVGWIASEIDDWISAQMAKREGSPK